MPPTDRVVPRFAAEPPQELLPYGRWAETLRGHFLGALLELETEGADIGEPEELVWFPDRTLAGWTYVPVTARTTTGLEVLGHVTFSPDEEGGEPDDFSASADWTDELAERHPEWRLDVSDEVVDTWRGEQGAKAEMTLVWGVPLVDGGAVATAELGGVTVDQCTVVENRFTLLAPDAYRGDTLEVALYDARGRELARESLYEDDEEDEGGEEEPGAGEEGSAAGEEAGADKKADGGEEPAQA
jgi:hypothetical protein